MWLIGSNSRLSALGSRLSANTEQAFTFVELMITVVILTVGLILIIQGFITSAGALNTASNYIRVIRFMDSKMQDIEATARRDNGVKREELKDKFSSDARIFDWDLAIVAVEKTKDLDLSEDLNKVSLKVSWQERNYPKDLTIATYLKNKKE